MHLSIDGVKAESVNFYAECNELTLIHVFFGTLGLFIVTYRNLSK
jgi:hypothetical protein